MPYFFVFALAVLATVVMAVVSIVCGVVPPLRPAYPYAWRVLVWSSVGLVVANIPVFALYFVPIMLRRSGHDAQAIGKLGAGALAIGLLIGPFVASAVGYSGGVIFGIWLGFRATRSTGNRRMRAG